MSSLAYISLYYSIKRFLTSKLLYIRIATPHPQNVNIKLRPQIQNGEMH